MKIKYQQHELTYTTYLPKREPMRAWVTTLLT